MKQLAPLYISYVLLFCVSFTNNKQFIPPGTVQINDTLFADKTEISNLSWKEFEEWTKIIYGTNSKEHLKILPDTLCWKDKLSYNEPYVNYYYRHIAYNHFPVVGISYEQAIEYCKWRTERVKILLSMKRKFKNQNFIYRLPTKIEWEKIAETSSFVINHNGKNEKGSYKLNCKHYDTIIKSNMPYADVTAPVNSYWKDYFGIYNMLGNVAEMVAEKGISKGGSWINTIEECRVGKEIKYENPTAWLGFRCVCIIKK